MREQHRFSATEGEDALQGLLASTSDPAYSVDEGGMITGWNRAAERFFGYEPASVVGRHCDEILRGRDVFGNPFCQRNCPLLVLARSEQPVRHFEIEAYDRTGEARRIRCFPVVLPSHERGLSIVHLLRPLDLPPIPWDRARPERFRLTERELEVLRLLASSRTTPEMAELMNITTSTVRKHVENLLRKLGARNRLDAVLLAFEEGIL